MSIPAGRVEPEHKRTFAYNKFWLSSKHRFRFSTHLLALKRLHLVITSASGPHVWGLDPMEQKTGLTSRLKAHNEQISGEEQLVKVKAE
jgi:hypothetical protein